MADILFEELNAHQGRVGLIHLNRPQALNSLTKDMCQSMFEQLSHWENDDAIKAVIVEGAGDKAFCAGGDVRALYQARDNLNIARDFFWHEYRNNAKIFHFKKPYIALLDGITMGGGIGISQYASHRVATEKYVWAMPETSIGFFPDVGGGYFLSQLDDHVGLYLGLTGNKINAADALAFGLLDFQMSSGDLPALKQAILDTDLAHDAHAALNQTIQSFQVSSQTSSLSQLKNKIAEHFGHDSVAAIIQSLQNSEDEWAMQAAQLLLSKSPTSLCVTFENIRRAKQHDFDREMEVEFNLALHFMRGHDFFEGVRAVLVDKDQKPQWQPNSLSNVTPGMVNQYFLMNEQPLAPIS